LKKVYTRFIDGQIELDAGNAEYPSRVVASFIAEEDLHLIGFSLKVAKESNLAVDVECIGQCELSQIGEFGRPGSLGTVSSYTIHRSATQTSATGNLTSQINVMFGGERYVNIPEGDALYLNMSGRTLGAGVPSPAFRVAGMVTLFLVKAKGV